MPFTWPEMINAQRFFAADGATNIIEVTRAVYHPQGIASYFPSIHLSL
jgi:hypothetical protein